MVWAIILFIVVCVCAFVAVGVGGSLSGYYVLFLNVLIAFAGGCPGFWAYGWD